MGMILFQVAEPSAAARNRVNTPAAGPRRHKMRRQGNPVGISRRTPSRRYSFHCLCIIGTQWTRSYPASFAVSCDIPQPRPSFGQVNSGFPRVEPNYELTRPQHSVIIPSHLLRQHSNRSVGSI